MVEKLGITPAKVVEGATMDLLGKECARLMDCNHVKSLVQVMEILAGFIFLVRESVKPTDVIRALLDQRSPNLGIRYLPMQNSGQMALQIKDDMLHAGITPNPVTWSSQINACAKAGLVDQTIQFFEEMFLAGCKPNSECYNILLHACDEAYQFDRAFCLFQPWKDRKVAKTSIGDHAIRKQSLVRTVRQKENSSHAPENASKTHHTSFAKRYPFSPTTTTHNILMKACGNDYHRAKALMEEMKAAGLTPNHISWSILIDLCGGSGNLLKMMRAAKIQPDVIAYATAIKTLMHQIPQVCVDGRQLKLAFSLYEEIKSCLCILLTKAWNNFGEVEARIVVLAVL
ncbi:pentatricopeptide repeat-containing protein At5g02830, chloroplastic-like [Eucalyptus grandis]|uniref:pentatricopeptide repeat-containing protein At5g02830, chloroplastic-like n=1 Tax=Eucalyptus grandis TaxID=71139 RepID=UPI00192EEA1A|nr:pentatricopeptide repeat-containing protein At5g02830, chloroplastic-like [Eucalyptus grandis]